MSRGKAADPARITFLTRNVELGALLYGNRRFARKAMEMGHAVDFVGLEGAEPAAVQSLPDGATVNTLGMRRFRQGPALLVRYFRRQRPSVVLVSGYIEGLVAVLAARLVRKPPRIVVRSHIVASIYLALQERLFDRAMLRHAMRWLFRPPIVLHAVSDAGARDFEALLGFPPGAVATLYDPVLPEARRTPEPFDHPWLHDRPGRLFLAVGRLAEQKDFATLLRAFAMVRADRPDDRLLILGEGPERASLERIVDELRLGSSVSLPGFVGDPETAYRAADVFVCSSAYEGLCNVIIEAMAAGCPVVSTDCPVGPAEVLEQGAHGPLVPIGDVELLAAAMLSAPTPGFDREAARRRAHDFHIDSVWPKFAELAGIGT